MQRPYAGMAEDEEPEFGTTVICDGALDRFIADLGAHALVRILQARHRRQIGILHNDRRIG